MTIAAGLRCSGGIIFAADTEETVGDIMRRRVYKIPILRDVAGQTTTMVTGACNNAHAMDTFVERIFDAIIAERPKSNQEFGAMLREVTLKLYKQDFRFYSGAAINVSLLISTKLPSEQQAEAWSLDNSIVRKMLDKEILGYGSFAEYILNYLYAYQMELEDGVLAMTQLLTFAKKHVVAVGGDSYVSVLRDDGSSHEENLTFSPGLEGLFDYFLSRGRQLLLATGKKGLTPEQYDEISRKFIEELKSYRQYGIS